MDGRGRALQLRLDPGQRADIRGAEDVAPPQGSRVVADTGNTHCIPPRVGRKAPARHNRGRYRQWHQVEDFFQCLKRCRSVASRFDKNNRPFLASISLAAILDWLHYAV